MRALASLLVTMLLAAGSLDVPAQDDAPVDARTGKAMVFLTKIRLADPDYGTVLMACFKQNELNILLSSRFPATQIPDLVKGLADQLSKAFPGENLRVVAFRPIVPLHEAGIAAIDGATGALRYFDLQATPHGFSFSR